MCNLWNFKPSLASAFLFYLFFAVFFNISRQGETEIFLTEKLCGFKIDNSRWKIRNTVIFLSKKKPKSWILFIFNSLKNTALPLTSKRIFWLQNVVVVQYLTSRKNKSMLWIHLKDVQIWIEWYSICIEKELEKKVLG